MNRDIDETEDLDRKLSLAIESQDGNGIVEPPPRHMASRIESYRDSIVEEFEDIGKWRVKIPMGTTMEDVGLTFIRKGDAFNYIDERVV